MSRRLPLLLLGLVTGCGEGPSAPPSTTATPSSTTTDTVTATAKVAAGGWMEAGIRIPAGAPFPLERFEGSFPPPWKLGDHWGVLLMEVVRSYGSVPYNSTLTFDEYDMRVIAVPQNKESGEYRIKAVDRQNPKHTYTLTFSGRNRCLLRVHEEGRDMLSYFSLSSRDRKEITTTRPPVPYFRDFRGPSAPAHDPVLAFPCLPADPKNPWMEDRTPPDPRTETPPDLVWQLVEERDDTLVFTLGAVGYSKFVHDWWGSAELIVEWRRGAPWWTVVKEADKFSPGVFGLDPSMSHEEQVARHYHELSDGHLVVGRLLQPGEKRPLMPGESPTAR